MTPIQRIRAATAPDHDIVDSAFGGFDLADRDDYAGFLVAHARVLPAIEAALAGQSGLPDFPGRSSALAADLAALGMVPPEPLPFAVADGPAAWGALYVVEGSRLGGIMLAARVGPGLPSAYLSARHASGAWRALLASIDAAAGDDDWIGRAIAGAKATFAFYAQAAAIRPAAPAPRSARSG